MLGLWTVMLLAVTFTSTTYALFKLNSHADIQFNFKVNGGLGFLVSVDNMNFSNDITYDKLLMAYYNKTHKDYTEWSNGKLIDSNTKEEISMDRLIEEFERIQADHDVYNSLGGNHDGDSLFGLVEHKYKNKIQ